MAAKRKKKERSSKDEEALLNSTSRPEIARSNWPSGAGVGKPLRPSTAFETRLFELCKQIPKGKVSTYGAMAQALNSSARAVGQGMRRNPFAPVVPCHRVIAANLELGGFSGSWGAHTCNVQRKRKMLEDEGVRFAGAKVMAEHVLSALQLRTLLKP